MFPMKNIFHHIAISIFLTLGLTSIVMANESPGSESPSSESPNGKTINVVAQPLRPLTLEKNDHICLIGNALGERMQHQNWWETALHSSFPDLELTVRNLCFPGDEPKQRSRSKDFGSPHSHLTHSKASVVLYFFGFNESFKDLERFKKDLS